MTKERIPYWEKLKDPRWQKKRLELMEKAGWKCAQCGTESTQLAIHHKLYLRSTDPWDYEAWAYEVVCEHCHKLEQSRMENAHTALARIEELMCLCASIGITLNNKPESLASFERMFIAFDSLLRCGGVNECRAMLSGIEDVITHATNAALRTQQRKDIADEP